MFYGMPRAFAIEYSLRSATNLPWSRSIVAAATNFSVGSRSGLRRWRPPWRYLAVLRSPHPHPRGGGP